MRRVNWSRFVYGSIIGLGIVVTLIVFIWKKHWWAVQITLSLFLVGDWLKKFTETIKKNTE